MKLLRLNHINIVVEDMQRSAAQLGALFDAEFLMDLPQAEWHAGLIDVGNIIVELFAPPTFLLSSRYGPHYLGIEYQADMASVRDALAANGVRIIRDIGVALHTHPADCFGIAFEFYGGQFHDNKWPLLGRKMRGQEYWATGHGLGLMGLSRYTAAVAELDAASRFIESVLAGTRLYEIERPLLNCRARGFQIADTILELQTALGDGDVAQHWTRWGDGIRSTVFRVRDIAAARTYFAERNIPVSPGATEQSFSLPAADTCGVLLEFEAAT